MFSESGFAIDTNLFVFPAPRRLLHGIALETGKNIFLLPEVHREIAERKRIRSAEVFRWRRRQRWQKLDAGGPVEKMERIRDAIGKASLDWYEEELSRPDGVFRRVQTTDREVRDVARIGEALPKRIFKGWVDDHLLAGDPLIVAEAIFHKIDLLSTNNLTSIDHDQLNAWLRSKGGWNHDLIHTPSQTIQEICQDDIQRVYQHFIAHGTIRVSAREHENRTEFVRALNALSRAGFGDGDDGAHESDAFKRVVYRVDAEFRFDRHFAARFQEAIASPHREPAIESERRLNSLVNVAVKEAERAWAMGEDGVPGR